MVTAQKVAFLDELVRDIRDFDPDIFRIWCGGVK
jgi:hypothetical protein